MPKIISVHLYNCKKVSSPLQNDLTYLLWGVLKSRPRRQRRRGRVSFCHRKSFTKFQITWSSVCLLRPLALFTPHSFVYTPLALLSSVKHSFTLKSRSIKQHGICVTVHMLDSCSYRRHLTGVAIN